MIVLASMGALDHFRRYEDVYVRTPQGWRFKSHRCVNESQAALKAPAARTGSPSTAR